MATLPTLTKPNAMGVTAKNPLNVNPNPIAPLKTGQMNTTPATIPSKVAWKDTPEGIAFQKEYANTIDNVTGQVIQTNGKNVAPKSSPYNPSTIQRSLDRGIAIQALGLASTPKAVTPTAPVTPQEETKPTDSILETQNNTPPMNTVPADSNDTPETSNYKNPNQIAEEEAAADRANKPQTNEPAPIQKPQDTTYGGLLTQLAGRGTQTGPEYQKLNQTLIDLNQKLADSKAKQAEASYANSQDPAGIYFQRGKEGLFNDKFQREQNAITDQIAAISTQLGAANTQQGMQIGALGTAIGAAAPVQTAPTITGYNPVTGAPVYGLGAGGANTLNAATNLQTNADQASNYAQKSTTIANSVQNLNSLGGQLVSSAQQVNPAGFTAGNTIAQLMQNQTNPGALMQFKTQLNAVQDQINTILSDPNTSAADATNLRSILTSLTAGTLNANQLQSVIATVTQIGNTLAQSYTGLANRYSAGGTSLVTGGQTNTNSGPITWESLTN